MHKMTLSASPM